MCCPYKLGQFIWHPFLFWHSGSRTHLNAAVRWTAAHVRPDGHDTLIYSTPVSCSKEDLLRGAVCLWSSRASNPSKWGNVRLDGHDTLICQTTVYRPKKDRPQAVFLFKYDTMYRSSLNICSTNWNWSKRFTKCLAIFKRPKLY